VEEVESEREGYSGSGSRSGENRRRTVNEKGGLRRWLMGLDGWES